MVAQRIRRYLTIGMAAAGLAIATSLELAAPPTGLAQSTTDGFTLFGGLDPELRLGYNIDYNKPRSTRTRLYLQVRAEKLPREALELEIELPETFFEKNGSFDRSRVELREGTWRGGDTIPVSDVIWDEERGTLEIYPEQPLAPESSFVIVIDRVRNPNRYGYHMFVLNMLYQGDTQRQLVGAWPLELAAE